MTVPTPTLGRFLQLTPACLESDLLAIPFLLHSGRHEAVVVLSEEKVPLGVIGREHLLSYLLGQPLLAAVGAGCMGANRTGLGISAAELKALLEPILVLPARMSLQEFRLACPAKYQNLARCALVGSKGEYLGLLDLQQLLQFLLPIAPKPFDLASQPLLPLCQPWLLQLLDRLPLPLLLQDSQGQAVQRNRTWREQLGEYVPPAGSHPEAAYSSPANLCWQAVELPGREGNPLAQLRSQSPDQPYCPSHCLAPAGQTHPLQTWNAQLLSVPRPLAPTSQPISPLVNGVKRVWRFAKLPLDLGNQPLGPETCEPESPLRQPSLLWLVLAADITEQQRLCQELALKNADLAQLNRLKDEFLSCISHELKSPLTAVVGLSSLLKEQKLGELNQRQAHYANLIYNSGHQLMTLVNDLLDLTRLETGQLKLSLEPVSIASVCDRAYKIVRDKQGKLGEYLEFKLEIEPGLDILVADELRLRQMLVHLLDNACKFTSEGGKVGLRVTRWENWVAFAVWDTGIGIPAESQPLIFQKFQQLENPLTRQYEGAGMGLVLTQRLARAHGGDISFISKVDRGSEFTLLLPPHSLAREARKDASAPVLSKQLVLIVEAVPRYIESLTDLLEELGYRAIVARSGTEALEKARQLQPSAILLDPLLPLLSGWDVLTLLKSDPRTQRIQVWIMTAHGDRRQAEQRGADGVLCLPAQRAELEALLAAPPETASLGTRSLTLLRLHPNPLQGWRGVLSEEALLSALEQQTAGFTHRLLEADSLEQAEIMTRVWSIDAIIIDSAIEEPLAYLAALKSIDSLGRLPLVTLDSNTAAAANEVGGLSVFPCLMPPDEQNLENLLQVIQIAARLPG